jgi:hypothetical protein
MGANRWTSAVRRRRLAALPVALALAVLAWASLAPIGSVARESVFEIPPGTYAHRLAGEHAKIFPQTIRLTLGRNDVLVLKNGDSVPHIFGPTLIMPGQTFRLPFEAASTYTFQCTAHPNGGLSVIVDPEPRLGLARLRWRWRQLTHAA